MRDNFLPFSPPLIGREEIKEVIDTLRSDWITTGPKVKRFEKEFSSFIGAPAALALNSGTAALHVGLAVLGIGPGDAVITTPMTFSSCVHVIEHVGARPILVDVEADTLNIDPVKVEGAIRTEIRKSNIKIRAIIPVHLYGHPCEMDSLIKIAQDSNLAIIEDAAHSLPAKYKGQIIGASMAESLSSTPSSHKTQNSKLTCFSFYATKNLTTAEGGMLTGPTDLIEEARIWSLHGMSRYAWKRYSAQGSWYYEVIRPGFKYNMTDIQAAIGLHQLRKLPQFQARRREIVQRYNQSLSQIEEIQIPIERPEIEHAWHLYVIRLNLEMLTIDRARFIEELRLRNIGTSVHFIPIHLHPYYRDKYKYKPEDFPIAYREYQRIISLPLYPRMSDKDVDDVIEAVTDVVKKFRK